ncbi:MAG: hypothetical protein V4451_16875 [Pseudomonadota bacterium]
MNKIPSVVSVPCEYCLATGHHGTRHSVKQVGNKLFLRCLPCGGGWVLDASAMPKNAPPELVIQAMTNLIVNRVADRLEPGLKHPSEDPTPEDE